MILTSVLPGGADALSRHNPDYEATTAEVADPRLAYGGPDQITIHLFDCAGFDGPAQHVGSMTVPDHSPWDPEWVPLSPAEVAARMWNFRAAFWQLNVIVVGACMVIVGRDDPMPVHQPASKDPRFGAIWAAFRELQSVERDSTAFLALPMTGSG